MRIKLLIILPVLLAVFISCQKDTIPVPPVGGTGSTPNPSPSTNNRLSYGDTLFFLKTQTGNYNVMPVSKPNVPGKFKSFPFGLVLDSISGNIIINQSEAGIRYKIYYLDNNNTPLDSVKIVISGIDYQDAIYEIATTVNRYDTAFPVYNARPEIALPCSDDDDDDDDAGCVFDETDLNNDGNDDISGVNQEKLLVDIKKGTIDVEASFNAGVFGSGNPANGISKEFTFYYRITDASTKALNKITVRLYHFRTRSDIPQALLDTLNLRRDIVTATNSRIYSGVRGIYQNQQEPLGGISQRVEYISKPKRPPIIIIISQ